MRITRLRLNQYRNYSALDLAPHSGINVLVGDNAQGKTNAIEAVFLCAFGRSHRTSRDGDLIRSGQPGGYVGAELTSSVTGSHQIEIKLRAGERKRLLIDRQPAARLGELMGVLNVVMFAPEDLALVKGGPGERRRFLDMELSQCKPAYFYALQQYNAALRQRNALLKSPPGTIRPGMLEMWDVQLAALGAQIMEARRGFVERLYAIAKELHTRLSGGREELGLAYVPNVAFEAGQELTGCLEEALCISAQEDIKRGFTTAGPHRDDMAIYIGDVDVRAFGSQGQQRTAALSIKLSELALLQEEKGEAPVLLLDDVLSELDPSRQRFLMESVEGCQCFLTCTALEGIRGAGLDVGAVFRCREGALIKEE